MELTSQENQIKMSNNFGLGIQHYIIYQVNSTRLFQISKAFVQVIVDWKKLHQKTFSVLNT